MCQNKCQMTYSRSIVDSYMAFSNAFSFPRHVECSVSAIADLVFLVDGSWSVGRENFKFIRSFIGGQPNKICTYVSSHANMQPLLMQSY